MSPMTGKDAYPHLFILSFFKKSKTTYDVSNCECSVMMAGGQCGTKMGGKMEIQTITCRMQHPMVATYPEVTTFSCNQTE